MLKKTDKKFIIEILLFILAGILIVVKIDSIGKFFSSFLSLLSPLFVGLVLAMFLNRPVEYLKRQFRKIPFFNNERAVIPAVLISYLLFLGVLVGLFLIMIPQLIASFSEFVSNFDRYSATFNHSVGQVSDWLAKYKVDPEIFSKIGDQGLQLIESVVGKLPSIISGFVSSLVSVIAAFFLGLIISLYILFGKKSLKGQFRRSTAALIPEKQYAKFSHVGRVIQRIFSTYIYTQITEAVILGGLFFIGCSLIGLPYALIVSVANGLSVFIPVVGSWAGGLIGAVFILFASPDKLGTYAILVLGTQLFENNFIYPRRVNDSVGLPQLWVLIAITLGGGLFGIGGALVAVPVASVIYQLISETVVQTEQARRRRANEQLQEVQYPVENSLPNKDK